MSRKNSPTTVMRKWRKLPNGSKNSHTARTLAKEAGMKSMAEVDVAERLTRAKLPYAYEPETWKYQYDPQEYTPDFQVGNVFIEVKGKATSDTRKKMLAVQKHNPDKHIVIVFLKGNNKIRKGSKTTYLQWFRKHGFICFDFTELNKLMDYIREYK
jgi:hypothetical protein